MITRRWSCCSAEQWLRASGPLAWRRTFPGTPDQVSSARKLIAALFAGTGREDDAEIIVGELCNNAILHTRSGQPNGWFGVEVALDDLAYLAVTDLGGAGRPILQPPHAGEELAEGGWGISIIADLALSLGTHGSPELGHTVWADLELTGKNTEGAAPLMC